MMPPRHVWPAVLVFVASVLVAMAAPVARGLYRRYDEYAVEVYLDHPGVEYNLSRINRLGARPVGMAGRRAYFYRSPLDERIGVFIYIVGYPGSLAVRVQAPLIYSGSVTLRPGKTLGEAAEAFTRLGYTVFLSNNTLIALCEENAHLINVTIVYSGGYAELNVTVYSYTDIPRNLTDKLSGVLVEALGAAVDAENLLGGGPRILGGLLNGTLAAVLVYELYRLLAAGVLRGIGGEDIGRIASLARPGAAGPGGHIYYDPGEGAWTTPMGSGRFYILTGSGGTGGVSVSGGSGGGGVGNSTVFNGSGVGGAGEGVRVVELIVYPLLAGFAAASAVYIVARRRL